VPGMVDQRTGRILNAPALGWRDVELRNPLATATGLPVEIENQAALAPWRCCGSNAANRCARKISFTWV
jgi:predicted NBD/HSP70 family sugar kinase